MNIRIGNSDAISKVTINTWHLQDIFANRYQIMEDVQAEVREGLLGLHDEGKESWNSWTLRHSEKEFQTLEQQLLGKVTKPCILVLCCHSC